MSAIVNDTWLILPNSENLIKKAGTSLWHFIAQNFVPQLDNSENSENSEENSLKRQLERSRRDFTNVLHVLQIKLRKTKSTDSTTPEIVNWTNVGEKEIDVMMKETGFKFVCDWDDDSHKWIYERARENTTENKKGNSLVNSGKKIDVPVGKRKFLGKSADRGNEQRRNVVNNNNPKRLSDSKAEQLKIFLNRLKHGEIKSNGCEFFFFLVLTFPSRARVLKTPKSKFGSYLPFMVVLEKGTRLSPPPNDPRMSNFSELEMESAQLIGDSAEFFFYNHMTKKHGPSFTPDNWISSTRLVFQIFKYLNFLVNFFFTHGSQTSPSIPG